VQKEQVLQLFLLNAVRSSELWCVYTTCITL
jgi:hypothetical protein